MSTGNHAPLTCAACGTAILDTSFIWNGTNMYHTHCRPPGYLVPSPAPSALTADQLRQIVREELARALGVASVPVPPMGGGKGGKQE